MPSCLLDIAALCRVYLNGNQTEFSPYTTVPYNSLCNGNDWARNIATPTVGGQPAALSVPIELHALDFV